MAQHSLCSAMTPVLLTACQRQPSSSPSFVHMFNLNCVTHLIKFYPLSQIIYHISLVYNCGNTCGKFCDSLTIFEKVSSKKPNYLLRGVITCIITVLVHTSHLSSGEDFTLPHIFQVDSARVQVILQSPPAVWLHFFQLGAQSNWYA